MDRGSESNVHKCTVRLNIDTGGADATQKDEDDMDISTATVGTMGVDWEARVDFDRLRNERLARLRRKLERV